MKEFKFQLLNQNLLLNPLKAIYWEEQSILLIADLHLGKAGHFRKAGIPIPRDVHADDYQRIVDLYHHYRPRKILVLGDLFHSDHNQEWDDFISLKGRISRTTIELVQGNHDILSKKIYGDIVIHPDRYMLEPFIFTHKPLIIDTFDEGYNICGHVHPSVRVKTGLKQSVRLDCFYFNSQTGILPAFGKFTGRFNMDLKPGDQVFAIVNEAVIAIKK